MSMMSHDLMSSACEVDICGAIAMHALRLASGTPSALLDWNNNYADDPDKAVCFHCSNLPKHFFTDVRMDYQEIIAGTVGKDNTFGTMVGRVKSGPMTFARFSTDDAWGRITATSAKARSRTTRSTPSAARASCGSRTCRRSCASSASAASSTMWRPISRRSPASCTRR